MIDYLYDGSFEGLLTCIYNHYYVDKASGVFTKAEYQTNLINGYREVETDSDKAVKVYDAIQNKISPYVLRQAYRAFLSSDYDKGTKILKYIVLGFKRGYIIGSMHANPVVYEVESLIKKVSKEHERMLQFVRFSVMCSAGNQTNLPSDGGNEVLYAEVEPDNDVLELIGNHFADRYKSDPFIIRDVGRDKAIIAAGGEWYISEFSGEQMNDIGIVLPDGGIALKTEDELMYQRLWKTYFDHIAIRERKNSRCQRNFMPVRYWKHLTEML